MKNKAFDCVKMKWDIQRKQREELAGASDPERRRILADRVASDPVLGPFLQRIRSASTSSANA